MIQQRVRRTIILRIDEYEAVQILARQERRDLREQASVLIRQGLEECGLLGQPGQTGLEEAGSPE